MAAKNLGNVVGLLKQATAPAKKFVMWVKEVAPGKTINMIYDYDVDAWIPLSDANPFYQKPVLEFGRNAPPASPATGDRYVIGTAPTGAWAGFAKYIATWNGTAYDYTPPITTMQLQSSADGKLYTFKGTVWEEFAAGDGLALIAFNGNRPITRNIPGLVGVSPGGTNVKEFLENSYYPAQNPVAALSITGGNVREIGSDANLTLNWSVTKTTNPIIAITVNGGAITPVNGGNQNGSVAAVGSTTADVAFSMSTTAKDPVTLVQQTGTASVTLQIRHKRFWFVSNQDLIAMDDAAISAILNALTAANFEYATDRNQPSRSFNPASQYIYEVYLNSYGVATFIINNGPNTDVETKTFTYTNSKGYPSIFRLYRTANLLNGAFTVDVN